jgi:hypothetical protein
MSEMSQIEENQKKKKKVSHNLGWSRRESLLWLESVISSSDL